MLSEGSSRLGLGSRLDRTTAFAARLRRAGLVPVGRTTASELGLWPTTETILHGATSSPWSSRHSAGGSSGGSAAIVGAGAVPIAHANDGGGSIRVPAACCGVVGLKPSRGRISAGPQGGDPILGWATELAVTRSVRDTAAVLDIAAGNEPGDPFTIPGPSGSFAAEVGRPPGRLRVGVTATPWSGLPTDPERLAVVERVGRVLAEAGCSVVEVASPLDWEAFLELEAVIWAATHAQGVVALAASMERTIDATTLEPHSLALYEAGRRISAVDLLEAIEASNGIARSVGALFGTIDLLVTPTLPAAPVELGWFGRQPVTDARAITSSWARHETFTAPFNLTGQPAISLPLALDAEGLPIGVQLVARHADEATLLRAASLLESALPWADRIPPVHASRERIELPPAGRGSFSE
jgi:amidase